MHQNLPKTVAIIGPTASGKSDFAVQLAHAVTGEVISADSRQVYRGLDIGTGKITTAEMQGIPHFLLDVASPTETFTVSDYARLGRLAIHDILSRNHLPIICGGTGHYVSALLDGLVLPPTPPNPALRKTLEQLSPEALYEQLCALDQNRARTIDPKNPRRLVRAIEIATHLGHVPEVTHLPTYDTCWIGIRTTLPELIPRIRARLSARLECGMLDEARALHREGLSFERMEELGLEYRYMARYLTGALSEEAMREGLERAIIQYAKRQFTWWKKDTRIHWVDRTDLASALHLVTIHLTKKPPEGG